jgi:hypothetical protein
VLVLVADHGTGSSNMGAALEEHPCVFDVGEGFGGSQMLWTSAQIDECGRVESPPAMFDTDSHKLLSRENPKMELKIDTELRKINRTLAEISHPDKEASRAAASLAATLDKGVNYGKLYDGLEYNFAEYLLRVRDLICENVPENICPEKECTISTKMFPQFVDGITSAVLNKDDLELNACRDAQNQKAMGAWKDALSSFKENPRIATVTLERDEKGRQFSMFHRFSPTGTQFDCSFARPESEFAIVSKDYTDHQMKAEDCWKDPDMCLNDALKLVSLSPEAMGKAGSQAIADELERREHENVLASRSCSTDPLATFRRLKNEDVEMTSKVPHDHDDNSITDRDDNHLADETAWSLEQALRSRSDVATLREDKVLAEAAAHSERLQLTRSDVAKLREDELLAEAADTQSALVVSQSDVAARREEELRAEAADTTQALSTRGRK